MNQKTHSKSNLARCTDDELRQKLICESQSPNSMGKDLFGTGKLVEAPTNPFKKQVWEKLRVKHGYLG